MSKRIGRLELGISNILHIKCLVYVSYGSWGNSWLAENNDHFVMVVSEDECYDTVKSKHFSDICLSPPKTEIVQVKNVSRNKGENG